MREQLSPAPDGTNTDFYTSVLYAPRVRVFVNGLERNAYCGDGFVELGERIVRMRVAPKVGDIIEVDYNPASP